MATGNCQGSAAIPTEAARRPCVGLSSVRPGASFASRGQRRAAAGYRRTPRANLAGRRTGLIPFRDQARPTPAASPGAAPGGRAAPGSTVTLGPSGGGHGHARPGGRCARPWPPERASARSWPGGTHGQRTRSAHCQARCRATATLRGCRPASPGSAPVPATRAPLLVDQLAMAMQSPDDPPGCGAAGRSAFRKGGSRPGRIYPAQ
jgi:hypothetical protein